MQSSARAVSASDPPADAGRAGDGDRAWAALPLLVFATVAAISAAWLVRDRAPLIFDQLSHLQSSLFFDSFPGDYLAEERQFYPPAVHVVFTALLRLTAYRFDAAIAVLGIGSLAALMWATYGIGTELWCRPAGAYAAALVALYPAVYVHSARCCSTCR